MIRDESGSEFNLTSEVGTSFGQYILIDTKDSPQSTSRRLQASEDDPQPTLRDGETDGLEDESQTEEDPIAAPEDEP